MATDDSTGTDGTADEPTVEGSWSPRRSKAPAKKAGDAANGSANGKAAGKGKSSDPEVLAEEIEKTREELAETLDAIAEKVSPKRVTARTRKKVGEAASGAVDSVKESAGHAADAVKGAAGKAKASADAEPPQSVAEVPVEVAPTPGALADATVTAEEPAGAEAPLWTATLPPESPSRLPVYAGAGAALVVLLLVLRRRRR